MEALESRRLLSLGLPADYAVGTNPSAVVTADFNNDGVEDLAVANYSDSTVGVLLGNADGTFQAAVNSPTNTDAGAGAGPRSLAVGDFDDDGNADDVATVNNSDVSILIGSGGGALQLAGTVGLPAVTVPGVEGNLAQTPTSVAVGDLTGDGLLDLTVTGITSFTTRNGPYTGYYYGYPYSFYTYTTHNNGHVNVLIGDGSGNFTPPAAAAVTLLEASYPLSAVLEEFDAVPGLDLAAADYVGHRVRVLSGNNDGTFDAPVDYSTGWNPTSVLTGDVNGDGVSDLVTANYYSVGVLLGDGAAGTGDGTFKPVQTTALGFYPTSVTVGDLDADGKLDLVATSNSYYYYGPYEGQVNVLLGHGNGTFAAPRTTSIAGRSFDRVATGDFNGDGFSDVAVTDSYASTASVLINDRFWPPTPPPSVSINDATVAEGNAGSVNATFTVALSAYSDVDVTVHYDTADGTALAGSDYTAASGDVTIPAGEISRTLTVAVTGDRLAEPNETFTVNLSAAANATLGDVSGTGTIIDDEPLVYVNDVSVTEGNSGSANATFTVSLSSATDVDVTVQYNTANGTASAGSDYTAASGVVTIPAGQTSKTFVVAVAGDRVGESTEEYFVNLSGAANARIGDAQGVGTIFDNEPRVSINSVSKKEGNGGSGQMLFTVTLSSAYDQPVTVNYATANGSATAGSDYQAQSGSLTFAAGVTSMTFTVNVIADKAKEGNETFLVNLSAASSNVIVGVDPGIGTILDDDNHGKR